MRRLSRLFKVGCLVVIAVIVLGTSSLVLNAQEKATEALTDDRGRVSIPWDDFKKILRLDKDEIVLSWEEFQKLLIQTDTKIAPTYTIEDGKVVLTREQFKRLLDEMKPSVIPVVKPPADYFITKATYCGRMEKEVTSFTTTFRVNIFKKEGREEYVKIPLFPAYIALEEVLFDNKPALIKLENSMHHLVTDKVGEHLVTVNFSIKTSLGQGSQGFSFPIPQTSITILDLKIPLKDIEVKIPEAQQISLSKRGDLTHILCLLSPTTSINVKWHKRIPEVARGPAKIYADTISLLSIEEDALRLNTRIQFSILQNTVSLLRLQVPNGYNVLSVQGEGVGDWKEYEREKVKILEIPLGCAVGGDFQLNITAERLLPEVSMVTDISGFMVINAIREKGFIGVELKGNAEVRVSERKGIDLVDASELPASLINMSLKPLIFGFKYSHHPYFLALDVQKHKELPVVGTVIDSASGVTLFTEDGKLVHRIIYKIRNTWKQFLEVELPEDAQLWSIFVANEPIRPSRNDKGRILIPLNRSRQGTTDLIAFDVEIIYYQKANRFRWTGDYKMTKFPAVDVITSQMLWSVYLPVGYTYPYFGGTVEKERIAAGIRPLLGQRRILDYDKYALGVYERRKDVGSRFSLNLPIRQDEIATQIEQEKGFSQRISEIQEPKPGAPVISGTLPIKVQIPTTGQIYRFAKTIVSEEPLELRFIYVGDGIMWIIKGLILLLVLLVLYKGRRRIKGMIESLRALLEKPTRTLLKNLKPIHIPFILFVLMISVWFISKALSMIILFFTLLSLIYLWRASKWERRSEGQEQVGAD